MMQLRKQTTEGQRRMELLNEHTSQESKCPMEMPPMDNTKEQIPVVTRRMRHNTNLRGTTVGG